MNKYCPIYENQRNQLIKPASDTAFAYAGPRPVIAGKKATPNETRIVQMWRDLWDRKFLAEMTTLAVKFGLQKEPTTWK